MGLYNGRKTCIQVSSFRDLVTAELEPVQVRLCAQKQTWHVLIGCYSHINIGG